MFFTNTCILKYSHVSFKQRDNYRFAEIFSCNDMQSVLETFARFIYRWVLFDPKSSCYLKPHLRFYFDPMDASSKTPIGHMD